MPVRPKLICDDPSLAIQSQKDEADINVIVRNFGITGQLPVSRRLPEYGDYSGISDYRSALEAVKAAETSFLGLPSKVRAHFDNDPQAFLEYCSDRTNLDQLREWGLVDSLAPDAPAPAESK